MIKKYTLSLVLIFISAIAFSQSIDEQNYNINNGTPADSYNEPGTIVYPEGYNNGSIKTPVIFVHGITGKLSNSYAANIDQVINFNLKAAFVQLEPLGTTTNNGLLLKQMIDEVRQHFNSETVSIVAHSKGGMDTERALYFHNPDDWSIPSFGYEKVDAVYTLSSPLKGARVADVGATLSWFSGVTWALMWYTNGYSMTQGNVNAFHNWAGNWTVTSNYTFKNYYNPNGASYVRDNFTQDNTTRWWAHQSNDECYSGNGNYHWYFCYVGRPFHHSAGAYIDAYWEWDWFDSGWRNWHSDSDGFISEYRAKRSGTNAYPSLTPGAGDANYRTMNDANHTSLWSPGENHFTAEIAPYLHNGLFGTLQSAPPVSTENKDLVHAAESRIMASNGNMYKGVNGSSQLIIEENDKSWSILLYGDSPIKEFTITNMETGISTTLKTIGSQQEELSTAFVSVANVDRIEKGVYTITADQESFLAIANCDETSTAFAVNFNFDENKGYDGETIEVGIANKDNLIDFDQVSVTAEISMVSQDVDHMVAMDRVETIKVNFAPTAKPGIYSASFEGLVPGAIYSLRIEAMATTGEVLLSRNVVNTFYVKEDLVQQRIDANQNVNIFQGELEDKINMDHTSVYPNPTNSVFTVYNDMEDIQRVYIIDATGIVIQAMEVTGNNLAFNSKELGLEKGMYILKVETKSTVSVKQLMIE